MKRRINTTRFAFITLAMLVGAGSRLLPHPPNFTPLVAMALFGGAYFSRRIWAFLIPCAAMLLSDLLLNYFVYPDFSGGYFSSAATWSVYGSFVLIVGMGLLLSKHKKAAPIAMGTLSASLLFFILTNFGVWLSVPLYPQTASGLMACYAAAIPFFRNALLGDVFFSALFFGGFYLLQLRFPALKESRARA